MGIFMDISVILLVIAYRTSLLEVHVTSFGVHQVSTLICYIKYLGSEAAIEGITLE